MAELVRGDTAPDFRLQDYRGSWVSLSDFAGGKVIVYFFPQAMTPGCTVEAVDFSSAVSAFTEAGYTILGISPDEPTALASFISMNNLTLTLLSDAGLDTIKAYHAWGDRVLWGKVFTGLIRSTLVINVDKEGKGTITDALYGVRATGHVDRLKQTLRI